MTIHPGVEAVENLRRIVRRSYPTANTVVGAARSELIEIGEVVHTCTIPNHMLDEDTFLTHRANNHETACGISWGASLSSSSWELVERIDCPRCIEWTTSVRKEIADAIVEGLCGLVTTRSFRRGPSEYIWVEGHSTSPIQVMDDDVVIPDELAHYAPGIRLDVQTILAARG